MLSVHEVMVISVCSAMDTTLVPPQLRVKKSFSIEHILSKPEKSSTGNCINRCKISVSETENDQHIGYSISDSEKRRSCEILVNSDHRNDHSNDGALVQKHCTTPDSNCVDTCSDVASEESSCKLRLSWLMYFKY